MTHAYEAEAWSELYLMLGGSLAALAGLLFVAISIQIAIIREAPDWRTRAFGNTFALVGLLIQAGCVLMPQSTTMLGVELIVANVFLFFFVPVRAWRDLARVPGTPIPRLRLLAGMALWALGALGGVSLTAGIGGGLYLVTAASMGLIWLGILNAWSFITVAESTVPAAGGQAEP